MINYAGVQNFNPRGLRRPRPNMAQMTLRLSRISIHEVFADLDRQTYGLNAANKISIHEVFADLDSKHAQ